MAGLETKLFLRETVGAFSTRAFPLMILYLSGPGFPRELLPEAVMKGLAFLPLPT